MKISAQKALLTSMVWLCCVSILGLHHAQAQQITKLEYFFNQDPGFGKGTNVPVTPREDVTKTFSVDVTPLSPGFHQFYLRSKNASGQWSMTAMRTFYKENLATVVSEGQLSNVTKGEFFFDTDPGFGNGTNIRLSPGQDLSNVALAADITALNPGFHQLYLRFKNANGQWSMTTMRTFYKENLTAVVGEDKLPNVTKGEFFFDTDPGYGKGTNITLSPGQDLSNVTFTADITALSPGFHQLYLRFKNANGQWSMTTMRTFYKESLTATGEASNVKITKGEYYIDTDPGFGKGINIPFTPSTDLTNLTFTLNMDQISVGNHKLFVRFQDENGNWSATSANDFEVESPSELVVTVGDIAGPLCANSAVAVPFTVNSSFGSNNIFTAELSDANGSFTNAVAIGTLAGASSGTVDALIPANTPAGTNYRIRVTASSPAKTSEANSTALTINVLPENFSISGAGTTCLGFQTYTTNLAAQDKATFTWEVTGGGAINPNGNTATVNWTSAGTYTVKVVASNSCGNSAERVMTVTVNDAVPAIAPTVTTSGRWMYASTAPSDAGVDSYQWYVNGGAISGATGSSYHAYDNGDYTVKYKNSCGEGPVSNLITFSGTKQNQTIAFDAIPDKTYGDESFALSATASSGLPVTFSVIDGPAVISGNTITITDAGVVSIRATQAGNDTYNAASDIKSFTVHKADATVALSDLTQVYDGSPKVPTATTNPPGLPVNFTYEGSSTSPVNAGSYNVEATINSSKYQGTTSGDLFISKATQTITLEALPDKTLGDAPFLILAVASSNLPVTLRLETMPAGIATLNGTTVTILGTGTVTVTASQEGSDNFNAAPEVSDNFTINTTKQTISFAALPAKTVGDAPFELEATASSGLPVSFSISTEPATGVASLSGNKVTLLGATGTVTVTASQGGNATVEAADHVIQTFQVNDQSKQSQAITFNALSDRTFGDAPFILNATASSGLPVNFRITSGPATVSGDTVRMNGTGTVVIEARQPGDAAYFAAQPVVQSFVVNKASQSITFEVIPDKEFNDPPFTINAVASSGLPVSFTVLSGNATITESNKLSITGVGSVIVQASQLGNEEYLAAKGIENEFCVSPAQLITIAGKDNVCSGVQVYNVPEVPGMIYNWAISEGGTITSSGSTATVDWTTPGNFTLSVTVSSDCGHEGLTSNLNVIVEESIVPESVTNLLPVNGSVGLALPLSLSWKPSANAITYDLYLWPDSVTNPPAVPFVKDLREINYTITKGMDYGTWYNWQVVARNGCSSSQSTIQRFILRQLPDLTVHSVQAPESAIAGSTLGVRWKVSNVGAGSTQAEAWSDEVYLSADTVFNASDDILVGKTTNVTYLQPGQVYNGESNLEIPVTVFGQFYVFIRSSGSLLESNKNNNVSRSDLLVPITVVPLPDLRPNTIAIPATAFGNDSVTVTYSFKNEGNSSVINKGWVDQVLISPDSNFVAAGSIQVGSLFIKDFTLPKDSSYTQRHKFKIPHHLYGNYYVHVLANAGRSFEEISRANNESTSRSINVKLRPPVDLAVSNISAPATALSGFPVQVSWQVQNQGANGPVEVSWTDKVYISEASIFDINKATFIGNAVYTRTDAFLPDANYTQTAAFIMPDSLSGKFYVYVITDADSAVFEYTFKENNLARSRQPVAVNYAYADLIGLNGQLSQDTIKLGETFSVSWITENRGPHTALAVWSDAVYLSRDRTWSQDDKRLGDYTSAADLPSGEKLINTASFNIKDAFEGNYYVLVQIDARNDVLEYDLEGRNLNENNVLALAKPVYIKGYGASDVAVKDFKVGDPLFSGQLLSLSWVVENIGAAKTVVKQGSWQDLVFLSIDTIADPKNDILLSSVSNSNSISSGENYQKSVSVKLPVDKFGDYHLIFQTTADSLNSNDINSENNTKAIPVVISLTDPSDLVVEQVSPPKQVIAGEQLLVSYTIKNKGIGVTNESGWRDRMYLSSSSTFGAGALSVEVGSKERKAALISNTSYADSMLVNIPPNLSGTYYLIAFADAANKVYEHQAEENNTTATLIEILPPVPSDFVVTKLEVPTTIGLGDDFQSAYTIENVGTGRGLGIVKDGLYFSSSADAALDSDKDKLLGVALGYVDLQPGQAVERVISTKVKDINPGNYVGGTSTDMLNQILESNDNNNNKVAANNTSVTISELVLDVEKTALLNKDDFRYFKIEVAEDLDLFLTLTSSQAEGQNKIFIAYNRVPTSSDFDYQNTNTVSTNQQVFVPATKAGTYYVLMQTETEFKQSQEVKILVKALPFSILSITPKKVGQGSVTTTLTGARFKPDTKVYLRDSEGVDVAEATIVRYENSMQMRIRWQLEYTPTAKYDVVAVNGAAEVELLQGLEVEPAKEFTVGVQEQVPAQIRAGANGYFSFRMENITNVDIPYLQFMLGMPSGTPVTSYSYSKNVISIKNLNSVSYDSVVSVFEEDALKYATSLVRDLAPGDVFTINTQVRPNVGGMLNVDVVGLGYSVKSHLMVIDSIIEQSREVLLQTPGIFDEEVRQLALNPRAFRDTIIKELAKIDMIDLSDELVANSLEPDLLSPLTQNHEDCTSCRAAASMSTAGVVDPEKCKRQKCDEARVGCIGPGLIRFAVGGPFAARAGIGAFVNYVRNQLFAGGARRALNANNGVYDPCNALLDCNGVPKGDRGTGMFRRRIDQIDSASSEDGSNEDPCNPAPPGPPSNSTNSYPVPVIRSGDPNDIAGPKGHGPERLISAGKAMPYTIRFENDPKLATTAAQLVTISLPLDEELNPLSLRVGTFGFSGFSFQVPDNVASYTKVLDLPDSIGYDVEVAAGIDIVNKEAFWTFQTIDPRTGLAPLDPLAGFLPVNDSTGRGEGFVTYAVRPKSNVHTGDTITAQATIVFDIEDPISTNVWSNVVDATPPVTTVQSLPEISPESLIPIRFSGKDEVAGAGIATYVLYYNADNGAFLNYGEFTKESEVVFKGEPGVKYQFYSIGIDHVGNVEASKFTAEATTTIPAGNRAPIFKLNDRTITEMSLSRCVNSVIEQCFVVRDPEQELIEYTLLSSPKNLDATLTSTGLGFCISLLPDIDYAGIDSVQVNACDSNGNCNTLTIAVEISTSPTVSLAPFGNVSINTPAFQLTGGLPEGGTYSGPGVTNGKFDPAAVGVGTYELVYTVQSAGCTSSGTSFITVEPGDVKASISSFSPSGGPAGTVVLINGLNLSGTTALRFNGVNAANFTVKSNAEITATVPEGATTGKISAITSAGTAISSTDFKVDKRIYQSITFAAIADQVYGAPPLELEATSTSGLPVKLSVLQGPATISGTTLTITGLGQVRVQASQWGNGNYAPADPVTHSFSVTAAEEQSIRFAAIPDKVYGDAPFVLEATATSGLPVSFRIVSGSASVSGGTLTIRKPGDIIVEASQKGNTTYSPAPPVTRSFNVSRTPQSISFAAITDQVYGTGPLELSATSTSGLEVKLAVLSGPARIVGSKLTLTGLGQIRVQASQWGNGLYAPAEPVTHTFNVVAAEKQSIRFAAIPDKVYGDAPFVLEATATSGLPVSFRLLSGSASISGNMLTINKPGEVVVEASQKGNTTYSPAMPVTQTFIVSKAPQRISFAAIPDQVYGAEPLELSATATSGLEVKLSVLSGPARISGGRLTLTGLGQVRVQASQWGNGNYAPADPVTHSFNVTVAVAASSATSQALQVATEHSMTAYPNPFSSLTKVSFTLPEGGAYTLSLFDSKGALIKTVQEGRANAGARTEVEVSGKGLSNGTYLLRLSSKESTQTLRLVFGK